MHNKSELSLLSLFRSGKPPAGLHLDVMKDTKMVQVGCSTCCLVCTQTKSSIAAGLAVHFFVEGGFC